MTDRRLAPRPHLGGLLGIAALTSTLWGCAWLNVSAPPGTTGGAYYTSASQDGAVLMPAQLTTGGEARFIVKIEDVDAIEDIVAQYRRDPAEARKAFRQWAAGQTGLSGLRLESCSYSGELVLSHIFADDQPNTRAARDRVLTRIRSNPNVAYADPDFVASTSGEN